MGNKSKHLRHILPHIPNKYNTYIEPFIGSGALFLRLKPDKWIINDLNKDLINVWYNIENNPDEVINVFKNFGKKFKKLSTNNKVKYCKNITDGIDELDYDVFRASIYMIMKFCSYMGNIFVRNKFFFDAINTSISEKDSYFFLSDDNYKY